MDARGVGVDWKVAEIRKIAQAMLGTVDIIGDPSQLGQVFAELMRNSMARGVANAELRVWIPQGAQVLFIRQVSPTVEDLTHRGTPVNPLTMSYPTGSWGDEERDYHVAVRLPAKSVGQEQLAARVQLAVGTDLLTQGLVKAKWSSDMNLTAQINPEVAHYTGQAELAQVIQEGLAAKAAGDERDRHHQARPRRPAGHRERKRRSHRETAEGRRHRRRPDGYRSTEEGRGQGRRDGPGHGVDEDDANQGLTWRSVRRDTRPTRPTSATSAACRCPSSAAGRRRRLRRPPGLRRSR